MTAGDYAVYRERSVQTYADELARARDLRPHDALRQSEETFARMKLGVLELAELEALLGTL